MTRVQWCTAGLLLILGATTPGVGRTQQLFDTSALVAELGAPQEGTPQTPATSADAQDPPTQTPPEARQTPEHTGFQALIRTTGADFATFPRRPSTWVLLGIGAGAALLAHPADDNTNAHIAGSDAVGRFFAPGKWIGSAWVQVGASTGLYLVGRYVLPPVEGEPRTNTVSHIGYDLLRAQILSQALIHSMKFAIRRDRPTGECCSFPSGHAATAFAAASVLERHLGYRAAWPTLVIATYVGVSRLHDNRHYLSDILMGSAIGVATGWTIVGRRESQQFTLMPVPVRGGVALTFTRVAPRL